MFSFNLKIKKMKKKLYFGLLTVILILVGSCVKDTGHLDGMEDFVNHPVLWENSFSREFSHGEFVTPTLDESDNIYIVLNHQMENGYCDEDTNRLQVISYDKNGKFRWKKKKWRMEAEKLLTYDGRVYCLADIEEQGGDRCLLIFDAENGNITKELIFSEFRANMKISNERIYLTGYKQLYAYDLEGEEIWSKWVDNNSSSLRTDGGDLYIRFNNSEFKKYKDMGDFCEEVWSWNPNIAFSGNSSSIDFADVLPLAYQSHLYLVSKESGQTVNKIDTPGQMKYQHFVKDKGFLFIGKNVIQMYDMQGQFLWEIENEHYYKYRNVISIINNDRIYWGDLYGLYVANSSGEMLWKLSLNQDVTNLLDIVMNSEGDLICHSPMRGKIYCIKGDNSPPE